MKPHAKFVKRALNNKSTAAYVIKIQQMHPQRQIIRVFPVDGTTHIDNVAGLTKETGNAP